MTADAVSTPNGPDVSAPLNAPAAAPKPRVALFIATACGLGIAIFSLIPFNYFTGKVVRLQFELETAATNIEVMVNATRTNAVK